MITGLRSSAEFRSITKSKSIFGKRKALLTAIEEAIDEAHQQAGKFKQCRAMVKVRACCQAWVNAHPHKVTYKPNKYIGGTGSRRLQGIETLMGELDWLFNNTYRAQFVEFQRLMGARDTRIGDRSAKTLSSDEYVAEYLDPKHRSKASVLFQQYQAYDNPAGLSFQQWLADTTITSSKDAQDYIDMMWPDDSTGEAKQVTYLDQNARIPYRLVCKGGLYYRAIDGGAPFHSGNHRTGDSDANVGWAIFVMSPSGYFYAHSKEVGRFHHSSFLSGQPTVAAGCLAVDNGKIIGQNNASGHYKPGSDQSRQFAREVWRDMKRAVGETKARAYMRDDLKMSLSYATTGFLGPYYSALEMMESDGNPAAQVGAPSTPT